MNQLPLWRRALLGPMPLAYPIAAACILMYVLGVGLSLMLAGADKALPMLWAPAQTVLGDLGTGGLGPLADGQVWTLIASSYLHANLPHIALNLLCLLMIMPLVEQAFGRLRAFIVYGLSGIAGAVASVVWGEYYSLGASGAIFGLFGALVAYGGLRGDETGRHLMINAAKWAALNFLFGLVAPAAISNASHFGGFLAGVLAGVVMMRGGTVTRRFIDPANIGYALASLTLICFAIGTGGAISSSLQGWSDPGAYVERQTTRMLDQSRAVIAWSPDNAMARMVSAAGYLAQQNYAAAIPDLNVAIANGFDTAQMRNNRAWSLYKAGRAAEGLPDANAALLADPDNAATLDTRAHIYEALGRTQEAIADYRSALRIDPGMAESQAGLKRLTGE